MLLLEVILMVLLQPEGVRGVQLHHRAGGDVLLPCSSDVTSSSCSSVSWLYTNGRNKYVEVRNGAVGGSRRAARLSLSRNCSLIITNTTAEDAGRYTCWSGAGDTSVDLKILTREGDQESTPVSSGPPLSSIMWTLRLTALILMVGLSVGIIRTRGSRKPLKDVSVGSAADDDTVTYEDAGDGPAAPTLT